MECNPADGVNYRDGVWMLIISDVEGKSWQIWHFRRSSEEFCPFAKNTSKVWRSQPKRKEILPQIYKQFHWLHLILLFTVEGGDKARGKLFKNLSYCMVALHSGRVEKLVGYLCLFIMGFSLTHDWTVGTFVQNGDSGKVAMSIIQLSIFQCH